MPRSYKTDNEPQASSDADTEAHMPRFYKRDSDQDEGRPMEPDALGDSDTSDPVGDQPADDDVEGQGYRLGATEESPDEPGADDEVEGHKHRH